MRASSVAFLMFIMLVGVGGVFALLMSVDESHQTVRAVDDLRPKVTDVAEQVQKLADQTDQCLALLDRCMRRCGQ